MAMARFSATTGDGAIAISRSYSDTITRQSVSASVRAAACVAAMPASMWYSDSSLPAADCCSSASPSLTSRPSQRERS